MREEKKELAKLTSLKLLVGLFEGVEAISKPFFKASPIYRKSVREFEKQNQFDKSEIDERIKYLRRIGYIKTFVENKERFVELVPRGFKKIKKINRKLKIVRPRIWDKKIRVVIFDIPEKYRSDRDVFRHELKNLSFLQIQKSVYAFPFPCTDEITELSKRLGIEKYVTVMIADVIQGEEKIIDKLIQRKVLSKKDLK